MKRIIKPISDACVMVPALPFFVAGFVVRLMFHWVVVGFKAGTRTAAIECDKRIAPEVPQ